MMGLQTLKVRGKRCGGARVEMPPFPKAQDEVQLILGLGEISATGRVRGPK